MKLEEKNLIVNLLIGLAKTHSIGYDVFPCFGKKSLAHCITRFENTYTIWYNTTKDRSTLAYNLILERK